jgi:hypothetical protein
MFVAGPEPTLTSHHFGGSPSPPTSHMNWSTGICERRLDVYETVNEPSDTRTARLEIKMAPTIHLSAIM